MNLAQLAESAVERLGERTSLVFEGEAISNLRMLRESRQLQAAFAEIGLTRGDIVVLCMMSHPLVYPAFQGIFRNAAIAVPVMFMLTAPELRFVLEDTRAKGVVTDMANLPKVLEAAQGLAHIEWVLVNEGTDQAGEGARQYRLQRLLDCAAANAAVAVKDDDTALMLYASGTTGKPKGVMLSHRNLVSMSEASSDAAEIHLLEKPRISMSAMPMAHIFGIGVMVSGYLLPERIADSRVIQHRWFDPGRFMQAIDEQRCNSMAAVPTMLSMMLNHPELERFRLDSLEEVICGAAPLPVELAQAFAKRFGARVREIYGMTENAGIATANRMSEAYRPGSAGRPYKGVELKIFDDEDNELPIGERGEVVTRGPTTMKGYHNRPEATAEVLRSGWLHTGDVGYLDADGFLYIVDRKKDMIIKGGENIYPAELEDVLYRHPKIAEAAVVGVPHEKHGEEVVAFVVPRSGDPLSESEVLEHMSGLVTKFKLPARVFFVDALPKVGVGKILRRELREEALRRLG